MKRFLFLVLFLAQATVHAQEFTSDFNDQDFCEFDLLRLPLLVDEDDACGPGEFMPYAKVVNIDNQSFVSLTMSSTVPYTVKYKYKMELSVPNEYRYVDHNRTLHEFALVIPKLPNTPKIFDYLHENATAFVLAQWHATNDNSPPIAIRLLNTKELVVTIDIDLPDFSGTERKTLWRGNVVENQVMNFSVLAHWHATHGFLDVELNDKKIVEYQGAVGQMMFENDRTYYFKYGLYHSYKDKMPEDFRFSVLLGAYRQETIF